MKTGWREQEVEEHTLSPGEGHDKMDSEVAGKTTKKWSQHVTETSFALDLEAGVFTLHDPRAIALSLKRSAEASERRKSTPFRSAMSMLNFYINRAGKSLPDEQREILKQAKAELRALYGKGS